MIAKSEQPLIVNDRYAGFTMDLARVLSKELNFNCMFLTDDIFLMVFCKI